MLLRKGFLLLVMIIVAVCLSRWKIEMLFVWKKYFSAYEKGLYFLFAENETFT